MLINIIGDLHYCIIIIIFLFRNNSLCCIIYLGNILFQSLTGRLLLVRFVPNVTLKE